MLERRPRCGVGRATMQPSEHVVAKGCRLDVVQAHVVPLPKGKLATMGLCRRRGGGALMRSITIVVAWQGC